MEKVFLLMWLADISGSISVVGIFSCIVAAVLTICAVAEDVASARRIVRYGCWLLIPIGVAVVMPSQKTIQLLAVSSAAEAAVNTQLGAKGIQALNAILDQVIDKTKK